MCDTLPKGKVSLATITESWRSSAKRQPGRRLGSRSSGEGHQRRFDRTEPFHRIDLVAQQILIAKLRIPDHGDRLIQTLMALRLYDRRRDGKLPPQGLAHFDMESDTERRAGELPVSRPLPFANKNPGARGRLRSWRLARHGDRNSVV